MSVDTIQRIGNSVLQHGRHSARVYLMKLDVNDCPVVLRTISQLVGENGYTKVFAKVPQSVQEMFADSGYETEASIPRFFYGTEDALFMAKYLHLERRERSNERLIGEALDIAQQKAGEGATAGTDSDAEAAYSVSKLAPHHAPALANIYRLVFATYPFPIHEPEYITQTMSENVRYFGVHDEGVLVAVSSAELDLEAQNAEMTDFATMPEYRGQGLATLLLGKMEEEVIPEGIKTAYTIARARSVGMNATFAKRGYSFAGTLWNNTNISGSIESMNVWYKHLD